MTSIKLRHITASLLITISVWSTPSVSEECMVSTDTRSLMATHPDLETEKLISSEGRYSAVLKNGDSVIAKFSTCDLGISAHYFSVEELSNDKLVQRVIMFLSKTLPSDAVIKKVMPQLNGLTSSSFNQTVVLEGLGDQHEIIVKPSSSPIYKLHIQYNWIPPQR